MTGADRRRLATPPQAPSAGPPKPVRLPGFWTLILVLALGVARLAVILAAPLAAYPQATAASILLFALYAVPFWMFMSGLDLMEREPPVLLAAAFAWGGAVATTAAIPGNQAVHDLLAKLFSPTFAAIWGPALAGPTIEELLKALAVVMVVLVARERVNGVLDGMIYGGLAGLGFQVVENIVYSINAVKATGLGDHLDPVLTTFVLRGLLAGSWSHILFSALAGAGIAWFVVRVDRRAAVRWAGLLLGLTLAWLTHFLWNAPRVADGVTAPVLGPVMKGVPTLAVMLALVWTARHREADCHLARLALVDDQRLATEGELKTLPYAHLRARARRYARVRRGRLAEQAVRALHEAQAKLAVELSRADEPTGDDAVLIQARADVLHHRERMTALGHPEAVPGFAGRGDRLRPFRRTSPRRPTDGGPAPEP